VHCIWINTVYLYQKLKQTMEEKEELGDSTDGPDVRGACLLELI
jgi:hypothetical protein